MTKLRYYIFCLGWLWRNRDWDDNRHKYKAMNKEWARREAERAR